MTPTKDEIKTWLTASGRDRDWLAQKLTTTKSVVDSWFSSRGFPSDRLSAIAELMTPEDETSHIRIPFTDELLELAHKAASIVSADFQDFCARAILHRAEELIKSNRPDRQRITQASKRVVKGASASASDQELSDAESSSS